MIAFLEREHLRQPQVSRPTRIAHIQVIVRDDLGPNELTELLVDLDRSAVVRQEILVGKHSFIDSAYMKDVENACMADERVQNEIRKLRLPQGASVVVEPWAYATDGMNDMSERTSMCWFYMRLVDNHDANYYAYPLDLCAEVSEHLKVTKVYHLPSSESERVHEEARPYDTCKIHSTAMSEYHPSLRPPPRTTTKPYQVVQPEGVSFRSHGNLLTWEKWTMRVGFNYREGLSLHDIRYDGRSLFYRLSLAEMFVPYGDPRAPFPRKAAFDLGINANNLNLGCDCLGLIKYFDGWHNTSSGEPLKLPNTIITVSNYEYIFAFHFGQDSSIHYEVRATGILSTSPINIGDEVGYGTIVAPGVLAPYHQHLFSLRIDPAIDGVENSLQVEESHALPFNNTSVQNPFGVGYTTHSKIVTEEGGLDLDFNKNRTFTIINEAKVNPITESFHAKRSEYGNHAIWITRYNYEELFPAGKHTMQSLGGEGINSAIARRRNDSDSKSTVRNEDIVIWHTFGSTHNPRIEDWPVMPSEKMVVGLKPVNFFTGNPSIDVAVSNQEDNQSELVEPESSTCCSLIPS
ncbi:Copper amine oxidase [Penicillium italicum]|uniref:Amine oxidase n=1 Tax=Penicillium italicum TaxID=40296 RepID=A0A0A2LBF8_PENIT|nr:Copper amine oxidase [Penicillium italicum]